MAAKQKTKPVMPVNVVDDATAGPREARSAAEPPTPPIRFGDPESIARRGPIKPRKYRIRIPRDKKWKRYQPVWRLIEGEWKRLSCPACKSLSFTVVKTEGAFVYLVCAAGHEAQSLAGFRAEKPEE